MLVDEVKGTIEKWEVVNECVVPLSRNVKLPAVYTNKLLL